MDKERLGKVFARIDSSREDVIRIQRELTAIPALSPSSDGTGEWKKALKAKEFMDEIGYDSFAEYNAPNSAVSEGTRPNHAYIVKGKDQSRTMWIMSHLDIVPPGELKLWDTDPYELKVDGDFLYGRGVEDNQQGIVSSILMLKAIKEEGLIPSCNIGLLFISDEETGSIDGIQHILEVKPDLFSKNDLIYVPDSGSEDGSLIEVAEKSILWTKFITKGKQTHASRPDGGVNAFKAASNLVVRLQALYDLFPKENKLFHPSISTFEPTKKEANVPNVNSIPGEDIFYLDSRVLPDYDLGEVTSRIREICDGVEKDYNVKIEMQYVQKEQAAPQTSPDTPAVTAISAAIKEVYKVDARPTGIGGGTVAAHIRKKNFPVVVWARFNDTAHQANENCSISNVIGDAKVFAHIALQ